MIFRGRYLKLPYMYSASNLKEYIFDTYTCSTFVVPGTANMAVVLKTV